MPDNVSYYKGPAPYKPLFKDKDSLTLPEVVFQVIGAASVCWNGVEKAGLFQSDRAGAYGNELIDWIEDHYELKTPQS